MLGRPIPLEDAFQTFPSGNDTPRMQEMRRQRTIRTFMMFLMMLILMDGEEPRNRQMRKNREMKYLRQRKSGFSSNNNTLDEELFKNMRIFDAKVHRVVTGHSRFNKLINLNGDVDEEAKVEKWVKDELDRKLNEGINASTEKLDNTDVDEEAIRMVYHYPRNATGYYRGKWEKIQMNTTGDQSRKVAPKLEGENSNNGTDDILQSMMKLSEREEEIIDKVRERRGDQESLGIFLLPREIRFGNEATETPHAMDNEKDDISLVTEMTGRTVFQLFSRPIPAIPELSLLDGFVRLYDVNNEHFASPRNHLFLRVRGVAIHSIGRLSLVANDGYFRSALFLMDETEENSVHGDTGDKSDNEEKHYKKQRRLQDFIKSVHYTDSRNANDGGGKASLINQVRDGALELYTHYFNDGEIGGENWDVYADTIDDHYNENRNEQEKYLSYGSMMMPEKKKRRGLRLNRQRKRHLKSNPFVSDVEIALDKDLIEKNATTPDEVSQISQKNRFLMNKTKSSGTDGDQSKLYAQINKLDLSLIPHPYVPDDETQSLKKLPSFIKKNSPSENQFQHGLNCEFELNLDVKETKWSVGEWRTMGKRLMNDVRSSDPSIIPDKEADPTYEELMNLDLATKKKRDEALVMNLIGTIESPDCNFASTVNLTAIRTDWEQAQGKAINYSFYMMLACLTQIVLLLRQLLHTQAQSAATKVSMICIGWQGILDAMLCVGHILLCMMMQPVFTAFAMVAFFKLLIFCVIEMKYMVIIMQARINADNNYSPEDLRRRVASLHLRFYCILIFVLVIFWTLIQSHRVICLLALYSFWVPQIIQNVITETKNPLHLNYIYGMSLTRLIAPLYMYGVPSNFFMEFFPESTSDFFVCELLLLWMGLQAGILIAQSKYGTRFMIPTRFLPPKYNYNRQIPESLLRRQNSNERQSPDDVETNPTNIIIGSDDKGPRNRKATARNGLDDSHGVTTIYESHEPSEGTSLDCVICYNSINLENERGYMLAPCDHIFHRDCLEQWMEVKMECPICRMELPSL